MISVRAASRLHFGFLNLCTDLKWSNFFDQEVVSARRFGGAGLMIERPGLELRAEPSSHWSVQDGPLADRVRAFMERCLSSMPEARRAPHKVWVESAPAEHAGLGTGTQLGLAIARLLTILNGQPSLAAAELATLTGRGVRSAVGIHGFEQGGFIVEGGQRQPGEIGPLLARVPFPADWRVLVVSPTGQRGVHGTTEQRAFADLMEQSPSGLHVDTLCRLVLLGMLPCLLACDFVGFSEALYDFNVRVGDLFSRVQSGLYARPEVASWIAYLRTLGIAGTGQSSWGPTVFAVFDNDAAARSALGRLQRQFGFSEREVFVSPACNVGATCQKT